MTEKQVRKEVRRLFNKIEKDTKDEYERVIKKRQALDCFYKTNGNSISKNELLCLLKWYTTDTSYVNAICGAIGFGVLSGILSAQIDNFQSLFLDINNSSNILEVIIKILINTLCAVGAIYIIALTIVKLIKEWNKTLNDSEYNYVFTYHADILRKLLEADSFTLNYNSINVKNNAHKRVIRCRAKAKIFSDSKDKKQIDL